MKKKNQLLNSLIPYGRNLKEYLDMFDLSIDEFKSKTILDIGGGPSSFNAELSELDIQVISIDPLYSYSVNEISERFHKVEEIVSERLKTMTFFDFTYYSGPEKLMETRRNTFIDFIKHFSQPNPDKFYLSIELPNFHDITFDQVDFAFSSHFLFFFKNVLNIDEINYSIDKIMSFSQELRVFPYFTVDGNYNTDIDIVKEHFKDKYSFRFIESNYFFYKNDKRTLIITHKK